jgi:hypothetical protein
MPTTICLAVLSDHFLLRRPAGCSIDLSNGAEVICQVRDAAHNAIQLCRVEVALYAQGIEPALRLIAQPRSEHPPPSSDSTVVPRCFRELLVRVKLGQIASKASERHDVRLTDGSTRRRPPSTARPARIQLTLVSSERKSPSENITDDKFGGATTTKSACVSQSCLREESWTVSDDSVNRLKINVLSFADSEADNVGPRAVDRRES